MNDLNKMTDAEIMAKFGERRDVSRGQDMLISPPEAVAMLVTALAKRMYRDKWQVPDEHLDVDWRTSPQKVHDEFFGYARSALGFMRETIQSELAKTNSSLDISKNRDVLKTFEFDGFALTQEVRDACEALAVIYQKRQYIDPGHFTLAVQATLPAGVDRQGRMETDPPRRLVVRRAAMRTDIKVIREAHAFLNFGKMSEEERVRRFEAIKALNAELGVAKVIEAHYAGHDQRYFDLMENWK